MSESKRLVTVFMAVGLVLAVGVGVIVWRMSIPSSSPDAYQADAVQAPGSESAAGQPSTRVPATHTSEHGPAAHAPGTPSANPQVVDPLLPPNAVVNAAPRAATPTQVYRPSNVVPTTVAPAQDDALHATVPADAAPPAGSTAPEDPATSASTAPAEPAATTPPTAPTVPTVPTVPSDTPGSPTTSPEAASQPATTPQTPASENTAATGEPAAPAATAPQPTEVQQQIPLDTSTDPVSWWERMRGMFR